MEIARDTFVEQVIEVLKNRNGKALADENLTKDAVEEVTDRISLYLNLTPTDGVYMFDERLVRVAARIASGIFTSISNEASGDGGEAQIKSISDNGQTISFAEGVRNYLATSSDQEIFSGFTELLKPYRRCNVVS